MLIKDFRTETIKTLQEVQKAFVLIYAAIGKNKDYNEVIRRDVPPKKVSWNNGRTVLDWMVRNLSRLPGSTTGRYSGRARASHVTSLNLFPRVRNEK